MQPSAMPVVLPVQRVPLDLLQPLREELRRMERTGIIVKEDGPTDWVSPWDWSRKKMADFLFAWAQER